VRLGELLDERDAVSLRVIGDTGARCLIERRDGPAFAAAVVGLDETSGDHRGGDDEDNEDARAARVRAMLDAGLSVIGDGDGDRRPVIVAIVAPPSAPSRGRRRLWAGAVSDVLPSVRVALLGAGGADTLLGDMCVGSRRRPDPDNSFVGELGPMTALDVVLLDALGLRVARAADDVRITVMPARGTSVEHLGGGDAVVSAAGLSIAIPVIPPHGEVDVGLRVRLVAPSAGVAEVLRVEVRMRRADGLLLRAQPPPLQIEVGEASSATPRARAVKDRAARTRHAPPSSFVIVVARDGGSVVMPWSWRTRINDTEAGDDALVARPFITLEDDADVERAWGRVRVRRRELVEREVVTSAILEDDDGYVPPGT
jgi:hypothetical protein